MMEEIRSPFNQDSYSHQEMMGLVPASIRLGTFRVHAVIGVPSAALGGNGDYALRQDGVAGNHIYFKAASVWGAIA